MSEILSLKNAAVVVTGATGFIGSHLIDYLVGQGCTIHALVRETSDQRWLNKSGQVKIHVVDLAQSSSISCLEKTDYLFHCAGLTNAKTRDDYFCGNVYSCEVLYERCVAIGGNLKAIVHLSSLAAAGPSEDGKQVDETTPLNPITFYGKSKKSGEEIALKYSLSLPIKVIRPPVVYGPREENLYTFFKLVKKGWGLQIGKTPKLLSLIYITDLVQSMMEVCGPCTSQKKIYFVTDGKSYSWEDIAKSAAEKMNTSIKILKVNESVLVPIAIIFEILAMFSSKPALFDRQRMIDIKQSCWTASPKNFFRDFDFKPKFELAAGLACTLDWYLQKKWL